MTPQPLIIVDFDSTFIKVETLDTLADMAYANDPRWQEVTKHVSELTNQTMAGQLSLHEALIERVKFLQLRKHHIAEVTKKLKDEISSSFEKNKDFIKEMTGNILIFSGGFDEVIIPVVAEYDIPAHHVYANRFIYEGDKIIGIDANCLMAHGDGKSKQLEYLMPTGDVYVIGDGSTDAITKNTGLVTKFYLYAENIYRDTVAPNADKIIYSLDEFIEDLAL